MTPARAAASRTPVQSRDVPAGAQDAEGTARGPVPRRRASAPPPDLMPGDKYQILAVEDDPHMLRFIAQRLELQGHEVLGVETGAEAIEAAQRSTFDLVILDVGLPGIDGFEVTKRIREFSDVPVIMLTGYTETTTKLKGFSAGADDYVVKPFNSDELLARIAAVMRRTQRAGTTAIPADGRIVAGDLEIVDSQRRVTFRGRVHVTGMEYKLLRQLTISADHVMEHAELLTEAWGQEYADDLGYLRVYIRRLREKIEPNALEPTVIRTIQGVGYMLSSTTA